MLFRSNLDIDSIMKSGIKSVNLLQYTDGIVLSMQIFAPCCLAFRKNSISTGLQSGAFIDSTQTKSPCLKSLKSVSMTFDIVNLEYASCISGYVSFIIKILSNNLLEEINVARATPEFVNKQWSLFTQCSLDIMLITC